MGMDASETPQAGRPGSGAAQLRDFDSASVAHDDVADNPLTVDEEPNLPGDFAGNGGNFPPEIQMDQVTRGNLAAVEAFEGANFLGFQTRQTPEKFSDSAIPLLSCVSGPLTGYQK